MEAAEKFGSMKDRVEGLLSTREDVYLGLLDVPHQGVSLTLHTPYASLGAQIRPECIQQADLVLSRY